MGINAIIADELLNQHLAQNKAEFRRTRKVYKAKTCKARKPWRLKVIVDKSLYYRIQQNRIWRQTRIPD